MSEKTKDRISPANIIALVGIAGIGVISCIGALLNSEDGSLIWPIIWATIVIAVLGGSLTLAIIAKGENSHRELWTPVMWVSFGVYIIAAVFMCNPFFKFFYIVSEKDNLQNQAKTEIEYMKSIFNKYEEQRKTYLGEAVTQLTAFKQSNNYGTPELCSYFEENVGNDIKDWMNDVALRATNIDHIKNLEEWNKMETEINQWNYLNLPSLAITLKDKQTTTWNRLIEYIENYGENQKLIPIITGAKGSRYHIEEDFCEFDLGEEPVSTFSSKLSEDKNVVTVFGMIAYIILNLLVLFNLLVAPSSKIIDAGRRNFETGGTTL